MLPDRVSNPGPLTYESGALPIALRGPAFFYGKLSQKTQGYSHQFDKLRFTIVPVTNLLKQRHFNVQKLFSVAKPQR